MGYITYTEYADMGGSLEEETFEEYSFEAQSIIDWYTFNRLKKDTTFPEGVKRCMYALIKLAKLKADSMILGGQASVTSDGVETTAAIASQSNDGVSISYNSVSASEVFNSLSAYKAGGEIESTVKRYLQGVMNEAGRKLLYRGVYPDE